MAVLGLRFCARAFSSCGKRGPLFIAVRGPLTIAASLVVEHRLQTRRLSNCGSRAQPLRGMWDLPKPGLEPVSPALAGGFSTTAPPGKPLVFFIIDNEHAKFFSFFVTNVTWNFSFLLWFYRHRVTWMFEKLCIALIPPQHGWVGVSSYPFPLPGVTQFDLPSNLSRQIRSCQQLWLIPHSAPPAQRQENLFQVPITCSSPSFLSPKF